MHVFFGTYYLDKKVLELILQKWKQLLNCPCQGQLMNCRDFLVCIIYLVKFTKVKSGHLLAINCEISKLRETLHKDGKGKPVFNWSIISCPPSIQKFFLHLQMYVFELKYSPDNNMLVSYTLSISRVSHSKLEFTENNLIRSVHFVLADLLISESSLKQF